MTCLTDHDLESLGLLLGSWGLNPCHARTVLRAFYAGAGAIDWDALNVGWRVRDRVCAEAELRQSHLIRRHESADGTAKLLVGFGDGASVEAVLMPGYRADRAAACVSSQVGCAMGCDFCASTRDGLARDLTAGEIVEQFLHLRQAASAMGRRLTSLVFMGMGEPLSNLDQVIGAIRRIADPDLGGLGWRQVTVSTVGLVPGMDRLAEADLNVHLALSLHAPDEQTRSRLVPANRRYPIHEVLNALGRFQQRTGRIPTIEYCLLAGVNDSPDQARALAELLAGVRAHVNLIPYNPIGRGISGIAYQRPAPEHIQRFLDALRAAGIVAHRRDTRGDDVNAACGQLKRPVPVSAADGTVALPVLA